MTTSENTLNQVLVGDGGTNAQAPAPTDTADLCNILRPAVDKLASGPAVPEALSVPSTTALVMGPRDDLLKDDSEVAIANGVRAKLIFRAARFAPHAPNDLLCVEDEGFVWTWAGQHFEKVSDIELKKLVLTFNRKPLHTEGEGPPRRVRLSSSKIDGVAKIVHVLLHRPGFFSDAPIGANCQTGMITLDAKGSAVVSPHDPAQRQRSVLNSHWPARPGQKRDLLDKLLNTAFPDAGDDQLCKDVLQEFAGAMVTGQATKTLPKSKALILHGPKGDNGKSQVADMFCGLLPDNASSHIDPQELGNERLVPGLAGKLLNVCYDLAARPIPKNTFKRAVSGEPLQGNPKHKDPFDVKPIALQLICTNPVPRFTGGADPSTLNRIVFVPFRHVVPEKDRILDIGKRVAKEEGDALLAWAIEGAERLARNGMHYTIPLASEVIKDKVDSGNPLRMFVDDVCRYDEHALPLTAKYLFHHYVLWAEERRYTEHNKVQFHVFCKEIAPLVEALGAVHSKHVGRRKKFEKGDKLEETFKGDVASTPLEGASGYLYLNLTQDPPSEPPPVIKSDSVAGRQHPQC